MKKKAVSRGSLYFLWHPQTVTTFSGYGLTVQPGRNDHLVGLLMVDRPHRADPIWLYGIQARFGGYELYAMTPQQERGIACQMWIEADSQAYVRQFETPLAAQIAQTLAPLLYNLPKPRLKVRWDQTLQLWTSEFQEPAQAEKEKRRPANGR